MKRFVLIALILTGGVARAEGNGAKGLYLTADDYVHARLTSEGDCRSAGHKVELHNITHKPFIDVIHEGETRRYEKSAIYGFRSCGGRDYRFVGNDDYQILESLAISIYVREVPARNPKDTSRGLAISREYFFSAGPGGPVLPLTVQNLKRAFPSDHGFHDALDMTLHTDDELAQYDTFHNMFKVNRLVAAARQADR